MSERRAYPVTQGDQPFNRWFGRTSVIVASAALLLAVIHPPGGLGVPVCVLHSTTGVPCPGCGLSRSLSSTVRGEFFAAWCLHPFGPVLVPILVGIVSMGLAPAGARRRVARWCVAKRRFVNGMYTLFVGAFLLFGALRAGYHVCLVCGIADHHRAPQCGSALGAPKPQPAVEATSTTQPLEGHGHRGQAHVWVRPPCQIGPPHAQCPLSVGDADA